MFELGQIISSEQVGEFVKGLAYIDDEMLNLYTRIFSSYICKKVFLTNLNYSRIDRDRESNIIECYSEDIINMPPIVTSPSFDGIRIVYDGCHRCVALENLDIPEITALVPYETMDGRLVEDMEVNKPKINKCKYGECDKGQCCIYCKNNSDCDGICSYCFELKTLYKLVKNNVALFCDGVW